MFKKILNNQIRSMCTCPVATKIKPAIENESNKNWNNAKSFDEVPGPKPIPIFGNLWHYFPRVGTYAGMQHHEINIRQNNQYGDLVRIRKLMIRDDIVFAFNPNDIEKIFRNDGQYPERNALHSIRHYRMKLRKDIFQGYGGVFVIICELLEDAKKISDGEDWQTARTRMNPILMQPRVIKQYIKPMEDIAEDFIKKIRCLAISDPNNEMPDDFVNELNKWALESVGIVSFDTRLGILDANLCSTSDEQQFIDDVLQCFVYLYKIDVLPNLANYISTPTWREYMRTFDRMTAFAQKQLEKAKLKIQNIENDTRQEYEISIMERMIRLDKRYALGTALDMLIGGIDTTARTMSAILYYLSANQEVQDKLRKEVHTVLPALDTPITNEKLEELRYLRAVIKETMRIAPIAIGTPRKTNKDLVLSGYQVPKGTTIIMSQLALYWNEKYFPNPKKFQPERWLRENKNVDHNPWVFLPFGHGVRTCLGRRIVQVELETLLAKVVRNFKLEWPHEEMKFKMEMLYGVANPLKIKLTPFKA